MPISYLVRITHADGRVAYAGPRASGTMRAATGLDAAARFRTSEGAEQAAATLRPSPRYRTCTLEVIPDPANDAAAH